MLGRAGTFAELAGRGSTDPDLQALSTALRPFFLRRRKEEVLADLPPKTEQVLLCTLGKQERRRYDELREHYRASLLARESEVGLGRMKIHVLEALLRLRQAALHPGLIDDQRTDEGSAKLDALLPRLEAAAESGKKALVFSQFTGLLSIVRKRLDTAGIPYEYLDGRTRDRKQRVERFQTDAAVPLFLISLKAGGQGLNLTAADYVFLLDPWWNPAVEAQAVDRAHRIGRERPVVAYRLIARGTIEERVQELQASKRALASALFGESAGGLAGLTRADLESLFAA
jgi:SNF2 family DNA or RNA helicase